MLWNWFMYTVIDKNDWTVEKIPRAPWNTSLENEMNSIKLHKQYLGVFVPETEIFKWNNDSFFVNQKFIVWTPVDLELDFTNEKIIKLLSLGSNMQQNHNV
jgi:hypothetical protein